jgi:hypothetical protein
MIRAMTIMLTLIVGTASAATVTVSGIDVKFTYDNATLFGAGMVFNNTIYFQPTKFKAQSTDGDNGLDAVTSSSLDIIIEVITPTLAIESFSYLEDGDYKLTGSGASASVSGDLTIDSLTDTYTDTSAFGTGALATTGGTLTDWSASTSLNLANTSGWNTDTMVRATITNILTTETLNEGELAFVEKKFAGSATGLTTSLIPSPDPIVAIPVPASALLFGSALGLLGWLRRKTN